MLKRVLLIDNDVACLDVLQEALIYHGFEVMVNNGEDDVFNLLDSFNPDLLVIDYRLAGRDGGQICSTIKTSETKKHLPVIIISAYPKIIYSSGFYTCNLFVPKPFDLNYLVTNINKLTARAT